MEDRYWVRIEDNGAMKLSGEKIKLLMESLDLSEDNARLALNMADGDLEKAIQMAEYVEPVILVIHSFFILGKKNREYGLFSLIAHGREGRVLSLLPVINYREEMGRKLLDASPESFIRDLKALREEGEDRSGSRLFTLFYGGLSSTDINALYSLAQTGNEEELSSQLGQHLKSYFGRKTELQAKAFLLSLLQCESRQIELEEKINGEEEEEESPFVMRLDASPMVAPNKGKPINQFQVGEFIPVQIVDKTDLGQYMSSLLTKKGENYVLAEITNIFYDSDTDRYQVAINFGPRIDGQFLVEPQIRLAAQEEILEEEEEEEEEQERKGVDWLLVLLLTVGFLLLLVIGLIVLF